MASELRRSFKQKAKAAFEFPFRLKKGLDAVTGEEVTDDSEPDEASTGRSSSFDAAVPSGYVAPPSSGGWLSGFLPSIDADADSAAVDSATTPPAAAGASDEAAVKSVISEAKRKKPLLVTQPKGTLPYVVTNTDTLASIAAQFDTTTSKLKKSNRLMSDMVIPGKTMYVPDKDYVWSEPSTPPSPQCPATHGQSEADTEDKSDSAGMLNFTYPVVKLRRVFEGGQDLFLMRMRPIFSTSRSQSDTKKPDDDWQEQFFKLDVKYIVCQQETEPVPGMLLISPQAVMFEPVDYQTAPPADDEACDEAVQRDWIIVPMDSISSIMISHHCDAVSSRQDQISEAVDEVFCLNSDVVDSASATSHQDEETFVAYNTESLEESGTVEPSPQGLDRELDAACEDSDKVDTAAGLASERAPEPDAETTEETTEVVSAPEESDTQPVSQNILQDSLSGAKRLPKAAANILRMPYDSIRRRDGDSLGSTSGDEAGDAADESPAAAGPGLMSRTLGSITALPNLFAKSSTDSTAGAATPSSPRSALDKSDSSPGPTKTRMFFFHRLVGRSTAESGEVDTTDANRSADDEESEDDASRPLYMCIKVGKKFNLVPGHGGTFVRTRLKPEYWFDIPRDRVDALYSFFIQWSPNVTGDGEVDVNDRGFVVLGSADSGAPTTDSTELPPANHPGRNWHIVSVKEIRRILSNAEVQQLPLPELRSCSKILENHHIRQLCFHLPARAEGCPWRLLYSSENHGFSLNTLYRCMRRIDAPILLVIEDDSDQVFGAMLPCALRVSETFYGNGESYLFSFYDGFKKYAWTGHNNFFIKGNIDSLSIGAGEGVYGLWLDGDLYHGRTQWCMTYDNDLLTTSEDFMIKCLEVWTFT